MNRFLAVGAGLAIDRMVGEPPTPVHPVAWFGSAMGTVERWLWPEPLETTTTGTTAALLRGAIYTTTGVALGLTAGVLVRSDTVAVALSVAGRELRSVASRIGDATLEGGLGAARAELPALVGRDPSELDESGIAAAVIESVGENSVDAVVAPALWALAFGARGALVYRAINTMDAMVGHRSVRYERFGTSSARLDDLANHVPARLFAALMALAVPRSAGDIVHTIRRDAGAHPSPNAGVAECAMAAAIDRQLGGPLRYGDRVEDRPALGSGERPTANDIARAVDIADRVERLLLGLVLLLGTLIGLGRLRSTR